MVGKIDLGEPRHSSRPPQRLLVATLRIVGRHQVDPVAVRASHPRRVLETRIKGLRVGRLTQIESLSADVNA